MTRLNWIFCNGSRWFTDFETQEQAVDYAHHCDLLRSHGVEKVWVSSDNGELWLRGKA
jgi:hypothetical protein